MINDLEIKYLKYNEQDNDWAKDVQDNPIHISQAKSGAQGYYCMGCDKDMQAVKRQNLNYKSYFRHHVKDVDTSKVECVHASRIYRERLAYFYFQRTKTITVPAVYKYPPKGIEGHPLLLKEKETIIAYKVEKEVTFYEDENGVIHRGKNINVDERYLWVRPDAVFFDKDEKPILFIEFVITHKPDIEKLNKLQRLGINTVQIIIPKLPEAELEKSISQVSKIKWTYNEIEANSEYISFYTGNSEGIPQIDEEQRKLFEESFKCRAAQIGNLIRSITRCLGSQSYKQVERIFEQEIQRIEKASTAARTRLEELEREFEREIYTIFEPEETKIAERYSDLTREQINFEQQYSNLERRYIKRRREIKEEQISIDREIKFRYRVDNSEEDIRKEFDPEETRVEDEFKSVKRQEGYIDVDTEKELRFAENFERTERELEQEFRELERKEQENFKRLREQFQSKDEEYRRLKTAFEDGVRSEYEREYEQVIKRFNERDIWQFDGVSERIKIILGLRGLLDNYSNGKTTLEKYRQGISIIKNGTWKEWNR